MPDGMLPDEDNINDVNLPPVTEPTPIVPEQGQEEPGMEPVYAGEQPGAEMPPEAEEAPAVVAVENMYQLIPIAMQQRRHLQIIYTSVHKGTTKTYTGEPYEVKDGFLWLWDIEADIIKSFYLSNISSIELLNTYYIPRFA